MNIFTSPRWLLIINAVPLLLLFAFGYHQYTLIEPLLEFDEHFAAWWQAAALTIGTVVIVSSLCAFFVAQQQELSVWLLLFVLGISCGNLILGIALTADLQPWSIPRWLREDNLSLYHLTAIMPTLAYSLLGLVVKLTPEPAERSYWPDLSKAVGIPLAVYLFGTIIVPLLGFRISGFVEYFFVIALATVTLLFLYFLVRTAYILVSRRSVPGQTGRTIGLVLVAIIAPLLGLALNNGALPFGNIVSPGDHVFGNFSHPAFYLIAGVNGLLLCLPRYDGSLYRLGLYLGRCVGAAFILYFFLIFLPYLPFALLLVLAFGLGLLMLSPLVLLPVQVKLIREDYDYLRRYFAAPFLLPVGLLAFLTLPIVVTINYGYDAVALDRALTYVYEPDQSAEVRVAPARLRRVLENVSERRSGRNQFAFSDGTPYLSGFYRWLVLDNLTLSQEKLDDLNQVFFGVRPDNPGFNSQGNQLGAAEVKLTDVTTDSRFDETTRTWRTRVELEMTNTQGFRSEFRAAISVPDGAFVTDYYLDIEGRREHGILAERKSATWVYNNIVNASRDPGFLRYDTPNLLALNVFPFTENQTRTTGIEFLHKEPLSITVNGTNVQLGTPGLHPLTEDVVSPALGFHYVRKAGHTDNLARAQVQGELALHLVLDASRQHDQGEDALINNVAALVKKAGVAPERITVHLAGTYVQTLPYTDDWASALRATPPGGFFAQRAVERILADYHAHPRPEDPRIVVVPSSGNDPVWTTGLAAPAAALPQAEEFYRLNSNGVLQRHAFSNNPAVILGKLTDLPAARPLRRVSTDGQPDQYLPISAVPQLLVTTPPETMPDVTDTWSQAAHLFARHQYNQLYGQTNTAAWLAEVRGSFQAGVLMPTTAFLALENEAQKEALRRKQAEVLRANAHLDVSNEEIRRMSEPWWVWVLGLSLFLYFAGRVRRP